MTSLIGKILDKTPVPFVGRYSGAVGVGGFFSREPKEAEMAAYGSVGTLFAIVHRTSEATSQNGWKLWRKAASGRDEDRVEVTRHAALDLWNKPNPFMTQQEFVESFQQHLDLTGEAWWLIGRTPGFSLPLELWPMRPDRMHPVPSRTEYLAGYIYCGPDGEKVPLKLTDVIQLRMPNPLDPYRGMGPVQSILVDLDSTRYSAEWNKAFFQNSAEPGGIVEVPEMLSDTAFNRLQAQWNEQHKGVANAHRVAILENGMKWADRKYTMRDMQFVELREVSREVIREAFAFPRSELGTTDDVNRANAEAGGVMFARRIVVPRLERIKQALNNDLLPMYGTTAANLEFDYDNPVPDDRESDDRERSSRASAARELVTAGYHPDDVTDAMGLPRMRFVGRQESAAQDNASPR